MFLSESKPSCYGACAIDVNGIDWSITQSAGSVGSGEWIARVVEPVGCHRGDGVFIAEGAESVDRISCGCFCDNLLGFRQDPSLLKPGACLRVSVGSITRLSKRNATDESPPDGAV